jgi:hypothetical protein
MGVLPERFLSVSQSVESIAPDWREAFERWWATNPQDAKDSQMVYLAGVCHALEVLGYVIDTYDKVRQEVEGEQ